VKVKNNKYPLILSMLFLSTCGARDAKDARFQYIGKNLSDVEACMGLPDKQANLDNGNKLSEWLYEEKAPQVSLPLAVPGADVAVLPLAVPLNLASTVQLNSESNCKALVQTKDNVVIKLLYSGASGNLSGRDGVCMPLIRGCLREWKGEQ
jgi:hypothetical protein